MSNLIKNKKYHFIYKTTNLINEKYYIGMHSTSNLKDGYMGSGKRLKYSIKKYGKENFSFDILEFLNDREQLVKREQELVNIDLLNDINCLNLQSGGISGFDYINKLRESDAEFNKKWMYIQANKFKQAHKNGLIKYDTFTGKKHSEETKQQMSKSHIGKNIGNNNGQYGTCWITKDGLNKQIKKEYMNEWFEQGWIKGRKL